MYLNSKFLLECYFNLGTSPLKFVPSLQFEVVPSCALMFNILLNILLPFMQVYKSVCTHIVEVNIV